MCPSDPTWNVLTEPLFTVEDVLSAKRRPVSLPGILAALCDPTRRVLFAAVPAHQHHAWYMFLAQLAALAAEAARVPEDLTGRDEAFWLEALRTLAPRKSAWALYEPDESEPAFLQPPVPQDAALSQGRTLDTPDQLDVIALGKAHDVKPGRMQDPRPEHWAYALVMWQTMSSYLGRGYYETMRASSGYSSRPFLGWTRGDLGERFRRETAAMLRRRAELSARYGLKERYRLLWLEPWDGRTAIPLEDLHPYAVEVARLVRLLPDDAGGLLARVHPSKTRRIARPEDFAGVWGDPWAPVLPDPKKGEKVLNVQANGFSYAVIHRILFESRWPVCLEALPEDADGPLCLRAEALARKQGGTQGFHARTLPLPPEAVRTLRDPALRDHAAERSRKRLADASQALRILAAALRALLGETARRSLPSTAFETLGEAIDRAFFAYLWPQNANEADPERAWHDFLRRAVRRAFHQTAASRRASPAQRYKTMARAEGLLEALLRKHFPPPSDSEEKNS